MAKKKLITSALPYVNNEPHLGNIIGCVLSADVYARFCRSRGYDTLYICGTDEYGTATENKARELGLTPREVCDKFHPIHAQVYKDFNISFDAFGRTSTDEQTEIAQMIFNDLDAQGLITQQTDQRVFCEKDGIFLADRYVEGTCPHCAYEDARGDQCDRCGKLLEPESLLEPRCKICQTRPVSKETTHLYLDLSQLQAPLAAFSAQSQEAGNWTANAVRTTQSWLEKGLEPRPITRDLKWGTPVPKPGFENKVFYVWFDAPIGYISITAKAYPEQWKDWWFDPQATQLYQFMAKDNIPFHTVIFPASLLGTGKPWTMLHHLNSTEYLNYEDTKFSKSRGIGVFGTDVRTTGIPTDLWRFYLLLNRPERQDSAFVWNEFFERVNSEFIDNLGNLVNRTLVYLRKNFDGTIQNGAWSEEHRQLVETCRTYFDRLTESMEALRMRDALRALLDVGNIANKFFQDMAPFHRIKEDRDHAHATVSVLTYVIRSLAVGLRPFMPETAERILKMMALDGYSWQQVGCFDDLDGHQIGEPEILYRKLDPKEAEKWRKKFSGDAPNFGNFKLVVGRIKSVDIHPENPRNYLLKVDLGEAQPRQIVAGLSKHYEAEQLQDRKVVVLANLHPAEIQGVESQGMVLVCEKRKKTELLDAESFEVGAVAAVADQDVKHETIDISLFKGAPFKVVDRSVMFDDQVVSIAGNPVTTRELDNGKIR